MIWKRRPTEHRSPPSVLTSQAPSRPYLVTGLMTAANNVLGFLYPAVNFVMRLLQRFSSNFARPVDQMVTSLEEGRPGVQLQKDPTTSLARLETLPLELLVEILKNLGWMDVLMARQTCKLLHEVSTAKSIWRGFLDEFDSKASVKPRLERPIELYTAAELERIFFHLISVDPGWTIGGIRNARQRDIFNQDAGAFHLVEGGRWLLLAKRTGSVTYHDLDNPNITEQVLIPDHLERHDVLGVLMDVDVDETAPILTFNLALSIERTRGVKAFGQVFRVHLELDDCQRGRTLQAERVASLHTTMCCISSLSLMGRYIAFYLMDPQHGQLPCTIILDWTETGANAEINGQGPSVEQLGRVVYEYGKIRLIPGNRLIVATRSAVQLYNFLDIRPSIISNVLTTSDDVQTKYAWLITIENLQTESLSKPFIVSDSTNQKTARLVVSTNSAIHGLIFPLNEPLERPQAMKLMNYRPGNSDPDSSSLGYNRGVIPCYSPYQLVLLRYSWPEDVQQARPLLQKKIVCDRLRPMNPSIDEASGRVVVSASDGEHIVVLDTALRPEV